MIAKLPDRNALLPDLLPFSKIDVIVTDLDGTLISGSEDISDRIKEKISTLRRKKVYTTIATGRTFEGARLLIHQINMEKGMPICLYNGAIVLEYGTDTLLYSNYIDIDAVYSLINRIIQLEVAIYIYTFSIDNIGLINEGKSRIQEKVYGVGTKTNKKDINHMVVHQLSTIEELKKIEEPIVALLIERMDLKQLDVEYIEKELSIENLVYTNSGNGFIEVKAKCKYESILAIGDNDNDKELFQYADISVAVENSSAIAIDTADYVCENESAYGFFDMLTVINNAKRYC